MPTVIACLTSGAFIGTFAAVWVVRPFWVAFCWGLGASWVALAAFIVLMAAVDLSRKVRRTP